ncbi:hypothetical protein [Streptomyces sp. GS7]|uniref:hypothetical protein n=1 Tax=Streptomyces sp. GS7 TaxID=2692234 RepID=UPI00131623B5|nr:hypothetical protein [Streptomyces sp. GS7]QHC23342.1 hypothetical protein GR130_20030 [Streptomyces sp. GS7]
MATVVDRRATWTHGGKDYTCTVTLPNGDSRQLQASSRTCRHLEPLLADQVPVVYDPAHAVLPIVGTKAQLGTAKTVLPGGIGLLLVLTATVHAIRQTATAQPEHLR